jgi:hypothetical protein
MASWSINIHRPRSLSDPTLHSQPTHLILNVSLSLQADVEAVVAPYATEAKLAMKVQLKGLALQGSPRGGGRAKGKGGKSNLQHTAHKAEFADLLCDLGLLLPKLDVGELAGLSVEASISPFSDCMFSRPVLLLSTVFCCAFDCMSLGVLYKRQRLAQPPAVNTTRSGSHNPQPFRVVYFWTRSSCSLEYRFAVYLLEPPSRLYWHGRWPDSDLCTRRTRAVLLHVE